MGAALLMGMLSSGEFDPADIAIVEPLADRRAILAEQFPGVLVSDVIPACDGAVLAVKPPDIPEVARGAAAAGARRMLSIAAGVRLMSALPMGVSCTRTMSGRPDALMSWSSCGITALRIRACHPSRCSRPRDFLVFVGSAMTDPAMEARLPITARR